MKLNPLMKDEEDEEDEGIQNKGMKKEKSEEDRNDGVFNSRINSDVNSGLNGGGLGGAAAMKVEDFDWSQPLTMPDEHKLELDFGISPVSSVCSSPSSEHQDVPDGKSDDENKVSFSIKKMVLNNIVV